MKGSSFGYLVREGSKSVWVNRLMSVASIGVLTACMLLIGASVLLSVNMNNVVGYVERQNEFVVFLKDDLSQTQQKELGDKLQKMDNIAACTYVSKEDAFQEQKEKLGEAGMLLDENDNFYPSSYRVKVEKLEFLSNTVDEISGFDGIDSVKAPTDIATTLTSVKQLVLKMGLGIVVLLVAVSLIIIANTIKITVFNRRKEITIMKYVGATDLFIKLPFMIEGLILGFLSATLAYFILWGGYNYLLQWVEQNPSEWIKSIRDTILPFSEIGLKLYAGFTLGGVSLGALGSMIFVRNYLKV